MDKLRVGITGQAGFIGTHLYHYLGLEPDLFTLIPFEDSFFRDTNTLYEWIGKCDVIIHLAALNRHSDPDEIFNTNLDLVQQLIVALEKTGFTPHILFASSNLEVLDNSYGRSKLEGRQMLARWAEKSGAIFTGLVIPNVFGPFGNPYYNSVVATFCHQLTHKKPPRIDIDKHMKLIYVGELVQVIRDCIANRINDPEYMVSYTYESKVTEILGLLEGYKLDYLENGMIPRLNNTFEIHLFNTFKSYMDISAHYPVLLSKHSDNRGKFVETMRLGLGGQVSFSTTKPGITRGNHFHTRKIERFAVVKGRARIQLRRIGTDEIIEYDMDGENPSFVDMPIWYTHNITNTGEDELITLFWINEFYNPDDPDTYYEVV